MVRNIDFPEALIFYDTNPQGSILYLDNDTIPRSGLMDLLAECRDVSTPAILITPSSSSGDQQQRPYSPEVLEYLQIFPEISTGKPPKPRSLWESIHSLTIQPEGFGGSAGFGRKLADPERSPLPARVVVFCDNVDVCRAARYAGMRVLCLQDNDYADAIIDDYYNLYLEDIATPGSFWLNPPYPRDDEGNKVDVFDLMMSMEEEEAEEDGDVDGNAESKISEDERLRAILDDLDPM